MIAAAIALAAAAAPATGKCSLPNGWTAIEAKRPRFIVFGEEHGTRESPELIGQIACALARNREHLLVAVELSASTDPELQLLWRLPTKSFAQHVLADLPGFAGRPDGVASRAMLGTLDRLHALHTRGLDIDVVAFNGFRDPAQERRWKELPGQGPHEAAQAENIATAAARRPYSHVLVLIGNLHAQKQPVERGGVTFEPMALRLGRVGTLLSLNQTYRGGTAWNCVIKPGAVLRPVEELSADKIDCGAHGHALKSSSPGAARVGLGSPNGGKADQAYDGYYWFPEVHASPPASRVSR